MDCWRLIVCVTSAMHLFWAMILLGSPEVALVTPMWAFDHVTQSMFDGISRALTAGLYGGFAILAVFGIFPKYWHNAFLLAFAQQIVICVSMIGIGAAVVSGAYPDGYVPHGGWLFIASDQAPAFLFGVLHLVALWNLYVTR